MQRITLETNNNKITNELLISLLSSKSLNGDDINDDTTQLIDILGGIDQIITHYLESVEIILTNTQLQQLYQILSTPNKYRANNKTIPLQKISTDRNNTDINELNVLILDTNDTYIHSLIPQKAQFIINALRSKTVKTLFFCSVLLWAILFFIVRTWFGDIICIFLYCFVWGIYKVFYLLSMNKTSFRLIWRTSFIFWFKLCNSIIFGVVLCIYGYTKNHNIFHLINNVLFSIYAVTVIIYVSAFDAQNFGRRHDIATSALVASTISCISIYFQWFAPLKEDMFICGKCGAYGTITYHAVLADTSRILSVFLWKQSLHALFKPKQCVLIRYTPYLIWRDNIIGSQSSMKRVDIEESNESNDKSINNALILLPKRRDVSSSDDD